MLRWCSSLLLTSSLLLLVFLGCSGTDGGNDTTTEAPLDTAGDVLVGDLSSTPDGSTGDIIANDTMPLYDAAVPDTLPVDIATEDTPAAEGTITGLVRLEGSLEHGGVTVWVPGTDVEALSGDDGAFELGNVPTGTWVVKASMDGYDQGASESVVVTADGTVDAGMITLAVPKGGITGTVTLEGAESHEYTYVALQGTTLGAFTTPSGVYEIAQVPQGQYTVVASHQGYVSQTVTDVSVTGGEETMVPLMTLATNPGTITGSVHLEGMLDHGGVLVTIPGTPHEAFSDETGAFVIEGLAQGPYVVEASHDGYSSASGAAVVTAGGTYDVGVLALKVGKGSLAGTVMLDGATSHEWTFVTLQGTMYGTFTSPSGQYALTGVQAGQYTLVASHEYYSTETVTDLTVEIDGTTMVPLLTLTSDPGLVSGMVALEGEASHGGVLVHLDGTDEATVSEPSGAFVFEDVSPGIYTVTAYYDDFETAQSLLFTVTPGSTITLPTMLLAQAKGNIQGVATLQGEEDHSGIFVELQGTGWSAQTSPDGTWAIWGIPVDDYNVVFHKEGYGIMMVPAQAVVASSLTTVPDVELVKTPGAFAGVAKKEDSGDHTGIEILLNGTALQGSTDATGAWTITDVPFGTYTLTVTAADYESYTYPPVELLPGATVDLGEIVLTREHGEVEGYVELENASDHSGVLVSIAEGLFTTMSTKTGYFHLTIPVGNYNLVTASYDHYTDASFTETFTVEKYGTAVIPDLLLEAADNDVEGRVTLLGLTTYEGITVSLDGIDNTATEGFHAELVTDGTGDYLFTDVPLGKYKLSLVYEDGWEEHTRQVDVVGGTEPIHVPDITLAERYLSIEGGMEWTNTPSVTLHLGSKGAVEYQASDTLEGLDSASWYPLTGDSPWLVSYTLSAGDGTKEVYVRYKDGFGQVSMAVTDTINMDDTAEILSLEDDTGGFAVKHGDTVWYIMDTGEAGGTAWVDVADYATNLALYDDGKHQDGIADDGVYGGSLEIQGPLDVVNGPLTGHFVDWIDNETSLTLTGEVLILSPPTIHGLQVLPDPVLGQALVTWTTDELSTGHAEWASAAELPDYPHATADTSLGLEHEVVVTGLESGVTYYLHVYVEDPAGAYVSSVDIPFELEPTPPADIVILVGDGRIDLLWDGSDWGSIAGYHVERQIEGESTWTRMTTEPFVRDPYLWSDTAVSNGTTYSYRVITVDVNDNESDPSTTLTGTPYDNVGPTTLGKIPITTRTVWTNAMSPFHLEGSIKIDPGAELIVGPGVEVVFVDSTWTEHAMTVEGTLKVAGTEDAMVSVYASVDLETFDGIVLSEGSFISWSSIDDGPLMGAQYRVLDSFLHDSITNDDGTITRTSILLSPGEHLGGAHLLIRDSTLDGISTYTSLANLDDAPVLVDTTARDSTLYIASATGCTLRRSSIVAKTITDTTSVLPEFKASICRTTDSSGGITTSCFPDFLTYYSDVAAALMCTDSCVDNLVVGDAMLLLKDKFHAGILCAGCTLVQGNTLIGVPTGIYSPSSAEISYNNIDMCAQGILIEGGEPWIHDNNSNSRVDISFSTFSSYYPAPEGDVSNNNFWGGSAENLCLEDMLAANNYWGDAATAEMSAGGPDTNISTIWDYHDDFDLGRVLYDDWLGGAITWSQPDADGDGFVDQQAGGDDCDDNDFTVKPSALDGVGGAHCDVYTEMDVDMVESGTSSYDFDSPSIAYAPDGSVHLLYEAAEGSTTKIRYATNETGSWVFTDLGEHSYGESHDIAVDAQGDVHAVIRVDGLSYFVRKEGVWSEGELIHAQYGTRTSIAIGPAGTIYATLTNSTFGLKLFTNEGSGWTGEVIDPDFYGNHGIAVDSAGFVHISCSWGSSYKTLTHTTNETGAWETSVIAAHPDGSVGSMNKLAISQDDTVHVLYFDDAEINTYLAQLQPGGWVTTPLDVLWSNQIGASIVIDDAGSIHMGWQDDYLLKRGDELYRFYGLPQIKEEAGALTATPDGWVYQVVTTGSSHYIDVPEHPPSLTVISFGCMEYANDADTNCDGVDGMDMDSDLVPSVLSGGTDCDDTDPSIYPGAADPLGDGIDQNCDGVDG